MNEMNQYLAHHGILGQKWGVRRYQNEDGSLTDAGKRRLKENVSYDEMEDVSVGVRSLKGSNTSARKKVAEAYRKEHDKVYYKYYDKNDRLKKKYQGLVMHGSVEELEKLFDKYIDKYADAALKDFKMLASEDAKKYVEDLLLGDIHV